MNRWFEIRQVWVREAAGPRYLEAFPKVHRSTHSFCRQGESETQSDGPILEFDQRVQLCGDRPYQMKSEAAVLFRFEAVRKTRAIVDDLNHKGAGPVTPIAHEDSPGHPRRIRMLGRIGDDLGSNLSERQDPILRRPASRREVLDQRYPSGQEQRHRRADVMQEFAEIDACTANAEGEQPVQARHPLDLAAEALEHELNALGGGLDGLSGQVDRLQAYEAREQRQVVGEAVVGLAGLREAEMVLVRHLARSPASTMIKHGVLSASTWGSLGRRMKSRENI